MSCETDEQICDVCVAGYGLVAGACTICEDTEFSEGRTTCLNLRDPFCSVSQVSIVPGSWKGFVFPVLQQLVLA
jgi:hypothetical protein